VDVAQTFVLDSSSDRSVLIPARRLEQAPLRRSIHVLLKGFVVSSFVWHFIEQVDRLLDVLDESLSAQTSLRQVGEGLEY